MGRGRGDGDDHGDGESAGELDLDRGALLVLGGLICLIPGKQDAMPVAPAAAARRPLCRWSI